MHRPGAAVAGVDHDLQRLQRPAVDVAQQVLDVVRADVDRFALAAARRRGRGRRRESAARSPSARCRALIGRDPSRTSFMPL